MRITLTTLLALLGFVACARAQPSNTTLGQVANTTHAACEDLHVYLQIQSVSGQSSYTVPAPGGIITSWSEAPLTGSGTERLVVAAPTAVAGQYTALAVGPKESVSGGTFAVHIPVQAGDILGIEPVSGSVYCTFPDGLPPGSSGDLIEEISGEHLEGEVLTPTGMKPERSTEAEERLNLEAVLQPDADHDGWGDTSEDGCPTDPSTHEACPVPTISGSAQVGQTLSANPGGSPENPSYAWLRCAANGEVCYAIPSATSLTYTVTSVDLGHTLRFRKTESNSQDSQIIESAPTALVPFTAAAAIAPKLSSFSQSARKWREGNALARAAGKAKIPLGTTFAFKVNRSTTVQFNFTQKVSGRVSAGKCVAQTKHNEHSRGCTRTVSDGTLSFPVHVGANKVSFEGRLSPTKKLSPGSYTVMITAGPSALRSASQSLSFTILSS